MVKHIIIWKLRDDIEDKRARAQEIKEALEGLCGKIEGLVRMHILIDPLGSSSGEIMMDSSFVDVQALDFYQKHPLHQEVANGLVRASVQIRLAFDYEE